MPIRHRTPHAASGQLDPPLLPFALAGTAIWATLGLLSLAGWAPPGWRLICLAGFLVGCGLVLLAAARARLRRWRGRVSKAARASASDGYSTENAEG